MPELPEVETIKVGLSKILPGKIIAKVDYDWLKSFPNAKHDVSRFLIGARITTVKRRAKVLLIGLDSQYSLVIHLKMTGQLVYRGSKERFGAGHPTDSLIGKLPDKSTRVVLTLIDNHGITPALVSSTRKKRSAEQNVQTVRSVSTEAYDTVIEQERWRSFGLRPKAGQRVAELFFNDQRKFGWMRLIPTAEVPNIDFFRKIGPEPLEASFTASDFRRRLHTRPNTSVKAALLDQTVIAGVGNIYTDESLWGAKIHPATPVRDLSAQKVNKLFEELQYVLRLSIDKGGSTDKNYVDHEGKKGSYLGLARVFRREGQVCPRCGATIVKIKVAGRGTHICPREQKL